MMLDQLGKKKGGGVLASCCSNYFFFQNEKDTQPILASLAGTHRRRRTLVVLVSDVGRGEEEAVAVRVALRVLGVRIPTPALAFLTPVNPHY